MSQVLGRLEGKAGVDMDCRLWQPRRARRVDQQERVAGRRVRRRSLAGLLRAERLVPPDVVSLAPGYWLTATTNDQRVLQAGAEPACVVGRLLQAHDLATAQEAVGRDQQASGAAVEPVGKRLGAGAGEDRRVDGAQVAAGQHGHDGLREHRQEDADTIAGTYPQRRDSRGGTLHLGRQLVIVQADSDAVFPFPEYGRAPCPSGTCLQSQCCADVVPARAHEEAAPG